MDHNKQRQWIARTARHDAHHTLQGFANGFVLCIIFWLGVALAVYLW